MRQIRHCAQLTSKHVTRASIDSVFKQGNAFCSVRMRTHSRYYVYTISPGELSTPGEAVS